MPADALWAWPGTMGLMVTPDRDVEAQQSAARTSTPPRYAAIAEAIRREIATGARGPGAKLLSEAELRARHGAARTTVRRALKVLEAEGLIQSQQGRGWRVCAEVGTSSEPAFAAIGADLRRRILGGNFSAGERLPSEKEMAASYACARGTIRRALVELELAGLIETRPGVGRFAVGSSAAKRSKSKESGGQ